MDEHSNSLIRKMLDNFPAMIGYWDKELKNKFSNSAYLKFFNLTSSEIHNRHIKDILGEELFEKNLPYLTGVLNGKEQFFNREIQSSDGTKAYAYVMYFPDIIDNEVVGFYVLLTDLSRLKVLEQEKDDIYQKLIQSNKMIALGEMASGIAHEINNPLSIIIMNSNFAREMLDDYNMDRAKLLNYITIIQSTSKRIQKIVSGLQYFSQDNTESDYRLVSLLSIIEDTNSFCMEKFKSKKILFSFSKVDKDLCIECDPILISQVLLNLLNNAADAIAYNEQKWISLIVKENTGHVEVLIKDSGKGISSEIANKIMQPFFTTKDSGKGVGLGLSISKGIIEKHKGTLQLDESTENTTFIIKLPKTQQK